MIRFNFFGIDIRVKFLFFAVITFFAVTSEIIAIMAMLASIIHEMGHLIGFMITKNKPQYISFEPYGIKIFNPQKTIGYIKEIIIILSGPTINFLLASILIYIGKQENLIIFGYTNILIGIFNIIPIGMLDGGRIVSLIFRFFLDIKKALIFTNIISFLFLIPIILVGVFIMLKSYNFSIILTSIYLLVIIITNGID